MRVRKCVLTVFMSVQAERFEVVDIETSFWYGGRYLLYLGQVGIPMSSGLGQCHREEIHYFGNGDQCHLLLHTQPIDTSKVIK